MLTKHARQKGTLREANRARGGNDERNRRTNKSTKFILSRPIDIIDRDARYNSQWMQQCNVLAASQTDLKAPNKKKKKKKNKPRFESLSRDSDSAMERKRLRAEFQRLHKRGWGGMTEG